MIHDQGDRLLKHGIAIYELDLSEDISFHKYLNQVGHMFLLNAQRFTLGHATNRYHSVKVQHNLRALPSLI
jgi:hypothetical protein